MCNRFEHVQQLFRDRLKEERETGGRGAWRRITRERDREGGLKGGEEGGGTTGVSTWREHFRWFATDEAMEVLEVDGAVRGIALAGPVLRKLYCGNAMRFFRGL